MGLARKLLNQSIKFDGKDKSENYAEIDTCIIGVIDFDLCHVEYNYRKSAKDTEQVNLRLNGTELVAFLKEARKLRIINVFGHGATIKYTRLELLQEIAKRKRAFFDNSDNGSMFDIWEAMPPEPEPETQPKPQRKTIRDEIEKKRVAEGNSKRQLVVRTGNDPQTSNPTINFL